MASLVTLASLVPLVLLLSAYGDELSPELSIAKGYVQQQDSQHPSLLDYAHTFRLRVLRVTKIGDDASEVAGTLSVEDDSSIDGNFRGRFNTTSRELESTEVCITRPADGSLWVESTVYHKQTLAAIDCEISLRLKYPPILRTIEQPFIVGELTSSSSSDSNSYFAPLKVTADPANYVYAYTRAEEAWDGCEAGGIAMNKVFPHDVDDDEENFKNESNHIDEIVDVYLSSCTTQTCHPFGNLSNHYSTYSDLDSLQIPMQINIFEEDQGRARGFLSLQPGPMLALEGIWKSNRICMLACSSATSPYLFSDCSVRVSLRFFPRLHMLSPVPLSGWISTVKPESDPSYFGPISIWIDPLSVSHFFPEIKYVYTKAEEAAQFCNRSKTEAVVLEDVLNPDVSSWFRKLRTVTGKDQLGNVKEVFIRANSLQGKSIYDKNFDAHLRRLSGSKGRIKGSFDMWITSGNTRILAEGFYDPAQRALCLIGCQVKSRDDLEKGLHCNVFIKIEFSKYWIESIHGSISSLQDTDDPLYLEFSTGCWSVGVNGQRHEQLAELEP